MKNIHVLPTNKPSRLSINCETDLLQLGLDNRMFHDDMHIYITSNEEIKEERCWVINSMNKIESVPHSKWGKLIILTTDQDLINDGVQAIDDAFLEWFVNNPSCEEVEVDEEFLFGNIAYKIIIPKEESELKCDFCKRYPKLESTNKCESCYSVVRHFLEQDQKFKDKLLPDIRKKQETLEEAAENYGWRIKRNTFSNAVKANELAESAKQDFIAGVKWQQERMYSEEEVRRIASKAFLVKPNNETILEDFDKWFEQFKKK